MRGLPTSITWFVRWLGGVDEAMSKWRGPPKYMEDQSLSLNGKL